VDNITDLAAEKSKKIVRSPDLQTVINPKLIFERYINIPLIKNLNTLLG
jgi:hypothetical protein